MFYYCCLVRERQCCREIISIFSSLLVKHWRTGDFVCFFILFLFWHAMSTCMQECDKICDLFLMRWAKQDYCNLGHDCPVLNHLQSQKELPEHRWLWPQLAVAADTWKAEKRRRFNSLWHGLLFFFGSNFKKNSVQKIKTVFDTGACCCWQQEVLININVTQAFTLSKDERVTDSNDERG